MNSAESFEKQFETLLDTFEGRVYDLVLHRQGQHIPFETEDSLCHAVAESRRELKDFIEELTEYLLD